MTHLRWLSIFLDVRYGENNEQQLIPIPLLWESLHRYVPHLSVARPSKAIDVVANCRHWLFVWLYEQHDLDYRLLQSYIHGDYITIFDFIIDVQRSIDWMFVSLASCLSH